MKGKSCRVPGALGWLLQALAHLFEVSIRDIVSRS